MRFDCAYGFKLVGNRYSNCQNGRWDTSIPVCVKSGCSVLAPVDSGHVLYEMNKATAFLSCFEGTELAGSRNTYCNGTHWDRPLGICRRTGQATATACDFETESLCGWSNDALHDFDWKRSDGTLNPRALRTGPKYDHTTMQPKAGHFMIVDSGEQLTNDTARFISPLFEPELSVGSCFQFYYHMYGETVGTLKVYVKSMNADLYDLQPVFVQQGNQKNVWHEGHVEVAQQTERFQIVIEASLGMRYKSDIAIDDVSLLQGDSCRVAVEDSEEPPAELPENVPVKIDSCENRCGSSMAAVLNNSDTIVHCDCHEDCVTSESCCPDYRERCVFQVAVGVSNHYQHKHHYHHHHYYYNYYCKAYNNKHYHDKPRLPATTTSVATPTSTSTSTTAPVKTSKGTTTTQSDMVWEQTERPTTEEMLIPDLAMAVPVLVEKHTVPSLLKFFIYALSALAVFVCLLSFAFYYARRSRTSVLARLKEKSQKSGFEDIRYLAGDEDLDFNLPSTVGNVEEGKEASEKGKQVAKEGRKDTKAETGKMQKREDKKDAHGCKGGGEETESADDSTDDDGGSGGVRRTHAKPNKKPYQKYVKHHDEDMVSTLL
uniref:MAM domain-containing protein n=1 Tax=Anopheles epiroticus TaxID=199890 RepID=A0A182NZY7_9DIPT